MTRLNSTFELALYNWVNSNVTGLTEVVWDKQKAPRPSLPYATLNLMPPVDETGITPESVYKTTDTYTLTHRFRVGVSVNIIADSSYLSKMQELIISLDKESVRTALKAAGLYYRNSEDSVDLTEFLDSQFEFRIQRDFHFGYVTTNDDVAGEIRRVIFEGDIDGLDIEVDETIT